MSKFNFIYAEDLSHREKTVYIYLRDRADASGVCWPGIKTIAGELVPSRFMRKIVCRLRLSEVSRQ